MSSQNKKLNVGWLLKGQAPTKVQLNQLKSYGKQQLKNMIIKGAHSEKIKDYLKSLEALDKIKTKSQVPKLSNAGKTHTTKIIQGQAIVLGSGGSLTIANIKLKQPSKKDITMGGHLTYWQISKLEKYVKNKQFINKIKINNSQYIKEVMKKYTEKTGEKISWSKGQTLARQESLREYYLDPNKENLETKAMENNIVGPIIESMGGWAVASKSYAEDLERLLNDHVL